MKYPELVVLQGATLSSACSQGKSLTWYLPIVVSVLNKITRMGKLSVLGTIEQFGD